VARTLVDLAEVIGARPLERALDQAEVLRLFDARAIEDILGRSHGRPGAAALRTALVRHDPGATLTRSELEERFLAICAEAALPRPAVNATLLLDEGAIEVDFLWRAERLIVETDGRAAHGTSAAFEADRERDRRLLLAGWDVVRWTWRAVTARPGEVAATLRTLLARGAVRRTTGPAPP
jgi:hypothetical protein